MFNKVISRLNRSHATSNLPSRSLRVLAGSSLFMLTGAVAMTSLASSAFSQNFSGDVGRDFGNFQNLAGLPNSAGEDDTAGPGDETDGSVDDSDSQDHEEFHARLEEEFEWIENKYEELQKEAERGIAMAEKRHEGDVAEIEEYFEERRADLEDELASIDEELEKRLEDFLKEMESNDDTTDEDLAQFEADLEAEYEEVHQRFEREFEELDEHVKAKFAEADAELEAALEEIEQHRREEVEDLERMEAELHEEHERVHEELEKDFAETDHDDKDHDDEDFDDEDGHKDHDGEKKSLVLDLGDDMGLWAVRLGGDEPQWVQVTEKSPKFMVSARLFDGPEELVLDLGEGGIVVANTMEPPEQILDKSSEGLHVADLDGNGKDEVVADLGSTEGLWVFSGHGGWDQLFEKSPTLMTIADVDGNGQDDILASFGAGFGTLLFLNGEWMEISENSASGMLVAKLGFEDIEDEE